MNFLSLVSVEFKKIRRSKILLIFFVSSVILWLPSVLNAHLNFEMQAEGISPEHNFMIQGFMGMSWFMFPASMVVGTVLLSQTEITNRGIQKMLTLPISTAKLCMAKFVVLTTLAAVQILIMTGMYYISASICQRMLDYPFLLSPLFIAKEIGMLFLSSIPMLAVFWMLSALIQTPIFSVGIGLASIVPSVFINNTKLWYCDPISYPFFVITSEYGKLAEHIDTAQVSLFPWIPVALFLTVAAVGISCRYFGYAERK